MRDARQRGMFGRISESRVLSLRGVRWIELDWHVLALAALLLTLGFAFVGGMADTDFALGRVEKPVDFQGHVQKALVALPAFLVGLALRPRWLRRRSVLLYASGLALLVYVAFFGTVRNGSRRWIQLPIGFDLQPSEFVKIGVVLMLALTLYRSRLTRLREWWRPLVVALLPMMLVALQPDLGSALTIVPITLGMLYLAGARARVLGIFVLGAGLIATLVVTFQIGIHDYQLERIRTWTSSFRAQDLIAAKGGPAFHSYHSRVAIGNGEVFGAGIGQGIANETAYLPERNCDSIFAVLAEESGFVGSALILGAYALFIALLMGSAATLRDRYSRLVVGGIAMYFASHLFIHVGVNLGLMPLTGIPLPFFSTGGSSMLATFLALGLALGTAANRELSLDQDAFRA